MNNSLSKPEFLETMRSERERWEALLAQADEAQLVQPGVAGDWSIKDIIAHVTAYERGLVKWLEAASRRESIEFPLLDHPDVDHRNAVIFSENQDRPLPDVLLESRQVFQKLLELVHALPEQQLLDPHLTEWFVTPRWNQSRPLWKCIADDSYKHYHQHIPGIRARLDQIENKSHQSGQRLVAGSPSRT
jgi:hypothetical protein